MKSKASKFRDQFEKALEIMFKKNPDWLMYDVYIYARDINAKSEEFPDWHITHLHQWVTTWYDRQTIKDFINEDLNS